MLAEAYRRLRTRPGIGDLAAGRGRISRAGASRVSRRHHDRPERVGARGSVRVSRRGRSRCRRSTSCAASTCSRCRRPTKSRRGCSCSRRWPTAYPSCSHAAARFPKIVETTGGGLIVEADDPEALADGCSGALAGSRPRRGARRGRRAPACSEHYSVDAMARVRGKRLRGSDRRGPRARRTRGDHVLQR